MTNLYDLETIAANLANWSDRIQANTDTLNGDTQRRHLVTLGENISAFSAAYVKASDGKAYKAKAASGMLPAIGLINETGVTSDSVRLITFGVVTNPAWTWTPQKLLVLSGATAGQIAEAPAALAMGPEEYVQVIGVSLSATVIFVAPALTFQFDFQPGSYTAAGKPVSGGFAGQLIFIIDSGTTGRMAYWAIDSVWRYVKDDSAV